MKLTLLFSTLAALLPAALATSRGNPTSESLPACNQQCLQRAVYQTAYGSASSAIGQALMAYNSSAWCTDERNADWCPTTINSTLSDIASATVSGIDFSAAPVNSSASSGSEIKADDPLAFWLASELAKASDKAERMAWSFASGMLDRKFTANGTDVSLDHDDPAVLLVKEIVYNMSTAVNATGHSSPIDKAAFQQALMEPRSPPSSTSVDVPAKHKDHHLAAILGTTIPVGVIGGMIGAVACTDPALCGDKTASFLAKVWHGLTGKNVWEITKDGPRFINDKGVDALDKLEEWVTKRLNKVRDPKENAKLDGFKPWDKFTEEVNRDSLRRTLTSKTWEHIPGENGEPLIAPPKRPMPQDVVRNQWYEPGTKTMRQEFLKPAEEQTEKMSSNRLRLLRDRGYRPYWKVNEEGDVIDKQLRYQIPETLKPVPATPEGVAPGSSMVLSEAAGKAPVLDSIGSPIMSDAGAAGEAPGLLSLVPIAPLSLAEAEASSSNWYKLIDDPGKTLVGFDNTERCLAFDQTLEPGEIGKTLHETTEGKLRGDPKPPLQSFPPKTAAQPTFAPSTHQPAPPQPTPQASPQPSPQPAPGGKHGDDHGVDHDWDHDVDVDHDWDQDWDHDGGDGKKGKPGKTKSPKKTPEAPMKTKSSKASETSASTLSTSTKKGKESSTSSTSVDKGKKASKSSTSTSISTPTSTNPALATPTNGKPCACSSPYIKKQKDDHFWPWNPPDYCKNWKGIADPIECSKGKKPCQCTKAYKEWKREKKDVKGWEAPVACALWGGVEDPDDCKEGHWFTGGAKWWDKGAEWPWAKKEG